MFESLPKPESLSTVTHCGQLGLELPIDHFRLLGVSPTTDAQSVLRALEQRLNRVPEQGFTTETLQAREALLRLSADLLTDSPRREAYESALTALGGDDQSLQAGLEIPTSRELGGLLLLLEADQPLECFSLARRLLQPPQAPTLGSGRESDLSLLAGLACLASGAELQRQRRYEAAALTLRDGLQLLQRMGQHPALRQQVAEELAQLRPFRVLDLLSRSLSAADERAEGLKLLEELVQERGGLEGTSSAGMSPQEFQSFFLQIRGYLTVQEQVDLFSRWADQSAVADFLASTALTASGFAQRKPERIAAAMQRLEVSGEDGIQPLLACLHLLLGQVEAAQQAFKRGAGQDASLKEWAEQRSGDPLAQLCDYCRDWLKGDVLRGYRDLEADPDLEAYFADRDVQAFIERMPPPLIRADPPTGDLFSPAGWPDSPTAQDGLEGQWSELDPSLELESDRDHGSRLDSEATPSWTARLRAALPSMALPSLRLPAVALPRWRRSKGLNLRQHSKRLRLPRSRRGRLLVAVVAAGVLGAGLWALLRPRPQTMPIPVEVAPPQPPAPPATTTATPSTPKPPLPVPLRVAQPSQAQVQALLETWLAAKAAVLAGGESPAPLDSMARQGEIAYLQQQRRASAARQQTLRLSTTVNNLTIEERSPRRITAVVSLGYSSQPIDAAGQPVGPAAQADLRNRYVFGRDGDTWRVVSFSPMR